MKNELIEKRAGLVAEAEVLTAKGDDMSTEDIEAVETLMSSVDDLDVEIEAAEHQEELQARVSAATAKTNAVQPRKAAQATSPLGEAVGEALQGQIEVLGSVARNYDNHGFEQHGDFLMAVHNHQVKHAMDERLQFSSMEQGVGSEGGFLVPPSFSAEIWDGLNTDADNLLGSTDQYTLVGTDSITFNANNESSRANGSRYGGVRGYWIEEGEEITASDPKTRQMKLEPKQLAVRVNVTDKLLRNATALQQFVGRASTEEINFMIGDAIINGNGVGKPKGILNSGATAEVAKETSQVAATVVAENVVKMFARLHPRCIMNSAWYINQQVQAQLPLMTIGDRPIYLPPTGLVGAPYGLLLGRPIIPIEYAAALGTVGDIMLADLSKYATAVQGGGIEEAVSMHVLFDTAKTAFRFMFAIDGQNWLNKAQTPYKGSATLSNAVTLAVRS